MTEEQINIAIAEACGWQETEKGWWYREGSNYMAFPPDYCNDLNAMHEAEWVLSHYDEMKYLNLITMTGLAPGVMATAHERAKAFLKTLGKWKEGK